MNCWQRFSQQYLGYSFTRWSALYNASCLPFIKQTYIFVVIIPIVANIINTLEGVVTKTLKIGQISFTIPLMMPDKWELLFFSALLFLVARIMIAVFCPDIIYYGTGYTKFVNEGNGYHRLLDYIWQYKSYYESNSEVSELKNTVISSSQRTDETCFNHYHSIYDSLDIYFPSIRLIIASIFAFGYALLGCLIYLNLVSVIKIM